MHNSISNKDGASLSLKNISEELVNRGHTVYVVYPSRNQIENALSKSTINIEVRSYSMRIKSDEVNIKKFLYLPKVMLNRLAAKKVFNILKDKDIDIIHINGINNEVGALVAKMLKIPYVWHIRAFLEEDLGQTLFNKNYMYDLLKKADRLIGISKSICTKYKKVLEREVDLIYNGVPIQDYIINEDHAFIVNTIPTIQVAGRITSKKGQMDAVKAVKILIDKGIPVNLYLVGYGVDDYYKKIIDYIEENNLTDYIKVEPYSEDLRNKRKITDIGLVTSVNEAFGRVTIENFLSKMLCIGSDTGGTAELIGSNYGLLYKQGDASDLAKKIEYAIDIKNRNIVYDFINNAFKFSLENFSISRVVDEIEDIYYRVLE
ncbi:MAG: glycosyltransferase family 4 protein [Peptoniphilaceae bacterium]|nr:glycosyltransferase family 4 protein [Peptoniphilaceae bacterium]